MLPSELLVVRRRGNRVHPVYLRVDRKVLQLIERLNNTFKDHINKSKTELREAVRELENSEFDYRQVRGLATILERRCQFEKISPVDPQEARKTLFHEAARKGIPTTPEERMEILRNVAVQLGTTPDELEQSLYADLDNALVMSHFEPLDAATLVHQYNLSLTQTLLFQCSRLSFTGCTNWHKIFSYMKWLGLMYSVTRKDGDYWVDAEGPLTLLRLSRRYGTRLAQLLLQIVSSEKWKLEALIIDKLDRTKVRHLTLSSERHSHYLRVGVPEPIHYDSKVEQDFAERFVNLHTGWQLIREPGPIPVGKKVMLPDFMFEQFGVRVYLEIAGFWTPEYIERKLRQLHQVKDIDLIVAADETHACQELEALTEQMNVIYYRIRVPLSPILKHLRAREKEIKARQREWLKRQSVHPSRQAISRSDLAKELGVFDEVVKEYLETHTIEGYRLLVDVLVDETLLARIASALDEHLQKGPCTYQKACEIIEQMGGVHPSRILEHLGYRIEWGSLDPDEVIVFRENP